jgi:3-deoxy-manno-octulosonate cytidylyltransferase (CMP-KDO synthetase)
MNIVACIPARYSSTRFPGKVLAKDTGKFLIQHVYEQASRAKLLDKVIIAADDQRVVDAAKSFGAECVLTSVRHKSGTDRIAEAVKKLAYSVKRRADRKKLAPDPYPLNPDDIVVNLQADEPEIDPANIDYLARLLVDNPDYPMATLAAPFDNARQIADPNIVKVVVTRDEGRETRDKVLRAIYFSRSPIPYDREKAGIGDLKQYLRHIGIYAYRKEFLLRITALPQTPLEKIEKLEQLRAIENGFSILVGRVKHTCDGIDTPQQYAEFVKRYKISHREQKI